MLKDFPSRIRELREKRGLTQRELAQAVGAHWMQVSRYERGLQLPTADRVAAFCRALHVTADALLFGDRKGESEMPFESVKLFERFRALDKLPKGEQETVLRLVDTVLSNYEWERSAEERIALKRSA